MAEELNKLLEIMRKSPAVAELIAALEKESGGVAAQTIGAAKPAVIAAIAQKLNRPMLLVTAHVERARDISEQINQWLGAEKAVMLPQRELLFYQRAVTDKRQEQERVRVLETLSIGGANNVPLIVVSLASLMEKVVDFSTFKCARHRISTGERYELFGLVGALQSLGYRLENTVEMPGEIRHRGYILDIWPITEETPFRLEFYGNNIESIRRLDPLTQRSLEVVKTINIGLAGELAAPLLNSKEIEKTLEIFSGFTPEGELRHQVAEEISKLKQGQAPDNGQFYAPLFNNGSLLDYLPKGGFLVLDEVESLKEQHAFISEEAAALREDKLKCGELPSGYPVPYYQWRQIEKAFSSLNRLEFTSWGGGGEQPHRLAFSVSPSYNGRLPVLLGEIKELIKRRHRFVFTSYQADRLVELLKEGGLSASPSLMLVKGSLKQGWVLDNNVHLLTDNELFGFVKQLRTVKKRSVPRHDLMREIKAGDFVVHIDHGIARYAGITTMTSGSIEKEYLVLEYAATDRLYVPADQIDRISRYVGAGEKPPTPSRLGTEEWGRVRKQAEEAAEEAATELLELYASRQMADGYAYAADTVWQQELEGSFPYIETPDQQTALAAVKEDMEKARPMDRLILGDVGYGKTEVALRAAFKAVMDGRQVAILVPTTILAQQHFTTFTQRLAAFPIKIEMLSRFRTAKQQQKVLEGLRNGMVDIVIGTHRLLQKDVSLKALGLLIIDEEQRFGVNHKEYIKKMRREVDVLSLSATPIPRTMYMSLSGLRDISLMETPPEERLPVRTYVTAYDERIIREAILREMERDGQVFFVHNRVQSIEMIASRLEGIVPEAVIKVAHGQMAEGELAQTMAQFAAAEIDVLVCSTIIESGVDMPNANTLIINKAEMFGLTQLYQLRGRVGRGANLSYAYLLYEKSRKMTPQAQQRLQTIYEAAELGAGYTIAVRDLEIRGAGNLLGIKQSGHISAVGFNLYTQLLARAVAEKKAQREGVTVEEIKSNRLPAPRVYLPLKAYIPNTYVTNEDLRLKIYSELAQVDKIEELADKILEFEDRFGKLPIEVSNLFYAIKIKLMAKQAGVKNVTFEADVLVLEMTEGMNFNRIKQEGYFRDGVKIGKTQLKLDLKRLGESWRRVLEKLLQGCG